MTTYDCAIVGGGLAGLTGLELAEAESFVRRQTASWDENGIHVESEFHRHIEYDTHLPQIFRKTRLAAESLWRKS